MNVSRTLFRCVFGLLLAGVTAVAYGQSFRKEYGPQGSACTDLVEAAGGGFVLVGRVEATNSLFLQRTDPNGVILWNQHQQLNGGRGVAVCQAVDGGFAVLCENYLDGGILRSMILKIDGNGATQWLKTLENPSLPNGFHDIVSTGDGGFAVVGDGRVLSPAVDFYIRLLKIDSNGLFEWERDFGQSDGFTQLGAQLRELPGGDLVLAGEVRDLAPVSDASDFFLARTDAQGNVVWQNRYGKSGYQRLRDFTTTNDGGLVILGETLQSDPIGMTLLKTGTDGSEQWYRLVHPVLSSQQGNSYNPVECFAADNAGNLYIPLPTYVNPLNYAVNLLKISSAGDSVWVHSSDLPDYFNVMAYTSDDKFALGGTSDIISPETAILVKTDWSSTHLNLLNTLNGTVFWDKNGDCSLNNGESGPPGFLVEARNQSGVSHFQTLTAAGNYTFFLGSEDYTLYARPAAGTEDFWIFCDTPVVMLSGINQSMTAPAIGVQNVIDCPFLDVSINPGPLRRCSTAIYEVHYCNNGSQTAANAYVEITADPLQSYTASSIPLSGNQGDTYTFDIGDVAPGECSAFWVSFYLSCSALNGQTICTEAHIYPDSSCVFPDSLWDGSNLEVNAACNGSAVQFTVTNTGLPMTAATEYVILEDQIIYMQDMIRLDAGADTVITIPNPAGNPYYFRANQRPGHPGESHPTAVADMCTGQSTSNLAQQLPLDDADAFIDINCSEVVGSFDPNDKRGFPLGWRNAHYIDPNEDIEYVIRFQNTGKDTAFLVVVRDQLPPQLDPATLRPGAASHPYTFEYIGRDELSFTFKNILLPDSTTNEPASHGFVSFRVSQKPDLPKGTVIENNAAIYFDFNDPVITNTYFHTISRTPLLSFTVDHPSPAALDLSIAPNPATEEAEFRIQHATDADRFQLRLYNSQGQAVRTQGFSGPAYRFQRQNLAAGLYYFRIEAENGRFSSGKLMLR